MPKEIIKYQCNYCFKLFDDNKLANKCESSHIALSLPKLEKIDFKALRELSGKTLRIVELNTGISNAYLSQLETGKIKSPSYLVVKKLFDFYNGNKEV